MAVVQGRMQFVVGGDRLEVGPGDELFIPAGVGGRCKARAGGWLLLAKTLCAGGWHTGAPSWVILACLHIRSARLPARPTLACPPPTCPRTAGVKHSTKNIGDGEARWLYGCVGAAACRLEGHAAGLPCEEASLLSPTCCGQRST